MKKVYSKFEKIEQGMEFIWSLIKCMQTEFRHGKGDEYIQVF
jgi:hypothetical protein